MVAAVRMFGRSKKKVDVLPPPLQPPPARYVHSDQIAFFSGVARWIILGSGCPVYFLASRDGSCSRGNPVAPKLQIEEL